VETPWDIALVLDMEFKETINSSSIQCWIRVYCFNYYY